MEITDHEKLLTDIVKVLNNLKIDYLITGGFAVSIWGRPRATFDLDIVIKLIRPEIDSLAEALRKISEAGYVDERAINEAIDNNGEFNFIDPNTGLKVDFWITGSDELTLKEFDNRKIKKIGNKPVYFISPEDLILSKLRWYQKTQSTRQLEDIESVFKISGKNLDIIYLKKWAKKLYLSKILNELLTQ